MCIELLSAQQYRALPLLGESDRKTSSWVQTPSGIRAPGGALFCAELRYGDRLLQRRGFVLRVAWVHGDGSRVSGSQRRESSWLEFRIRTRGPAL